MADSSKLSQSADHTDGVQLSKLSSVLNGLETGATVMRRQAQRVMASVRSGTYQVDPLNLSKSIVRDSLGMS